MAADDAYLSPYYGRESAMIDVQQFHGMPYERYFRATEEILKHYDGRPHWGKIHYRSAAELETLYPMWHKFQQIRHDLDPEGVFTNDYIRGVLGV